MMALRSHFTWQSLNIRFTPVKTADDNFADTQWLLLSEVTQALKSLTMKKVTSPMADNKKEHEGGMKNAVITGAKLALANQAGDIAVNVIVDMVPAVAPHMTNPAARALAKLLGAFVLSHSADMAGAEHAKTIRTTADLVSTAASMELTQSQLERLTPAFEQLMQLGKKLV